MFNYSQEKASPKLVMEISRNDQVPKLVTAHQISRSKDARNKLLMQARAQIHNHQTHSTSFSGNDRRTGQRNVQTAKMQTRLQQQISQNDQLRSIIKQLKNELQKLRQVNEGLITRIKQVQSSYRSLRSDLEKSNQEQQHKIKINIYSDVEQYVKTAVQRLTLNLKQEKMTISIQNKLERFLAELLQINAVSVEQFTKRSRQNHSYSKVQPSRVIENDSFNEQSRTIGTRYTTIHPQRQQLPSPQHYAGIMQRLTGQPRMSKSYAVPGLGFNSAASQDTKLRNVYATTPQKRRRIFQ